MKKILGRYIGITVFLLILLYPVDPSVFPTDAKYVAAATMLMIIWWITEAIPIEATALLPVIMFPLLGVLSPAEACAPYADKIIFLFLGGFMIAMSMQRWNLHERIALHIIRKVGTSPRMLILGFMVATAFLSMWISNTATAMMMIPIAIAIIATLIPKECAGREDMTITQKDFSECIVIAIAYAASIGGIATIIGTPPNGIFVAQMETIFPLAPPIDFFTWMKFALPLTCIFLPLAWIWLTYGPYRHMPDKISSGKEIIEKKLEALGNMGKGERWTLMVFVLTAVAWIMRSEKHIGDIVIPGITTYLPFVDDSTIAIAGAVLLFLLPVNRKAGIYTMNWEWAKKIPWGILILFGGGICLSTAFIKSGLTTVIMGAISFMHGLPVIIAVLVVALLISLLTEVTSNTAIASVMIPIMAVTSISMGIHPYLLMMTAAFACSMAFMLPVATPPNAVAFSTGYVAMRDMVKTGWILNIIGVFLLTIFMFTVISWVLGFSIDVPVWAFEPSTGL